MVSIFVVAFGLVYKGIELTNPSHSVEYRNAPKSDYQASDIVDEWARNNNQEVEENKKEHLTNYLKHSYKIHKS